MASEPSKVDVGTAWGIAMRCAHCDMTTEACSAQRRRMNHASVESTDEPLGDEDGFCCEECWHSSYKRDAIARAIAASREEGWREGMREAAGICKDGCKRVGVLAMDPKWSVETRASIQSDAEVWGAVEFQLRARIAAREKGVSDGE